MRRFQTRLLLMFLPLFLIVQLVTIGLVYYQTRASIFDQSVEAMSRAHKNFNLWLDDTRRRLIDSSSLLAADFGFRRAVGTADFSTVESALENLRRRIGADSMMLISLAGEIGVEAPNKTRASPTFPYDEMLDEASFNGHTASMIVVDGKILEFVVVPIRAPDVIGWIGVGIEIDDAEAKRLSDQSTLPLDVSFAYHQPDGSWQVSVSTLAGAAREGLPLVFDQARLETSLADGPITVTMADGRYVTALECLVTPPGGAQVCALIQYSLSLAFNAYRSLFMFLFVIAVVGVGISAGLSIVVSRGISKPVQMLDQAAKKIRSGSYPEPIEYDSQDEIGNLATTFNQMIADVAERERKIFRQANFDDLTGLPNRRNFERLLVGRLIESRDTGRSCVVCLLEIDHFSDINNTLGHELGDQLLKEAAGRILDVLASKHIFCRFATSTFAIYLHDLGIEDVALMAARILLVVETPLRIDDVNIDIGLSLGFVVAPDHGDEHRIILRRAEVALERARESIDSYVVYDATQDPFTPDRLSLMSDMRQGLERGEFSLHYQPKVALDSGRIEELEALIRWQHPQRGPISPIDFIGAAERTGYIRLLTRWVLRTAVEAAKRLKDQGIRVRIFVNISARDLVDQGLPSYIVDLLATHDLDTSVLAIEVTESAIMEQPEVAIELLQRLHSMGMRIAIDDFGTGHSSMAYVKRLPASELKIDRSFVADVAHNQSDQRIVRTIIELGHSFDMTVTAEGVEDEPTATRLTELGCDFGQGWFFGKPQPLDAVTTLLKEYAERPQAVKTRGNVHSLR
ncbi:MAG: EAL domain-containing protein [Proteobacteria bacterium]|nr:MAG: EAL domain-containing protein [Pseudomonadota bacterium]